MSKKNKSRYIDILLILVFISGIFVGVVGYTHIEKGSIINSGWESQFGITEITVNGVTFNALGTAPSGAVSWGTAYCKFDPDQPLIGSPNLVVQVTSPREYIARGGEWIRAPKGEVFDTINKKVTINGKEYNFWWDHHVFFQELKFNAQADHYWVGTQITGEAKGMKLAERAVINVVMSFECDPWVNSIIDRLTTDEANYTLDASYVWSGVMSASIASSSGGYSNFDPADFAGINGIIIADQTGRVNMWTDDNEDAAGGTMPADPIVSPDPDIPNKMYFEASVELQPGWAYPPLSTLSVAHVYAIYQIRVDVLTTAGYQIEDGEQEDTSIPDIIIDQPSTNIFGVLGAVIGDLFWALVDNFGEFALSMMLPIIIILIIALVFLKMIMPVLTRKISISA